MNRFVSVQTSQTAHSCSLGVQSHQASRTIWMKPSSPSLLVAGPIENENRIFVLVEPIFNFYAGN